MRKIFYFVASLAAVAGVTAHGDPLSPEVPDKGDSLLVPAESSSHGSGAPARDPFAAITLVLPGDEASAGSDPRAGANPANLPPLVDCFHDQGDSSVSSAPLADGRISSFRIGAEGTDKVTVSANGGLWVGVTAVDTHVIEIQANGAVTPGTYTLIDYEGAIGGAGFSGLVLRSTPHLHAELVNNTADTKIELVVSEAADLEWLAPRGSIWTLGALDTWMPFSDSTIMPFRQTGEAFIEDSSGVGEIGIFSPVDPL